MIETDKRKMTENLKTIIKNAIKHLPTGELLVLINLSARSDLYLNNNKTNKNTGIIEIELKNMIRKYIQFLK